MYLASDAWMCDSCEEEFPLPGHRYRCVAGCDADLCVACLPEDVRPHYIAAAPAALDKAPVTLPLSYVLLRNIPVSVLRCRYALLTTFAEQLLIPGLPLLDLHPTASVTDIHGLHEKTKMLVPSPVKEQHLRRQLKVTMYTEEDHGATITLNRVSLKRNRHGYIGAEGAKSVFAQATAALEHSATKYWRLPSRVWKVKFVGEGLDDCGGGYSESISEMMSELQSGALPLLLETPNARGDVGVNRDCFMLNPHASSDYHLRLFRFLGNVLGIAIRTGEAIDLNLAPPMWKLIAGLALTQADVEEMDVAFVRTLRWWRSSDAPQDDAAFAALDLSAQTPTASGRLVSLLQEPTVTRHTCEQFVTSSLQYRLHEFDAQVQAIREGLAVVVPLPTLMLFTGPEVMHLVCGDPQIDIALLKSVTSCKGHMNPDLITWFWEVLEGFTQTQRALFVRFAWGRTRLPRSKADFAAAGVEFQIQPLDKYSPAHADGALPEAYTCFFLLRLPNYSTKECLLERLLYAINFCKSIDTDAYARADYPHWLEARDPGGDGDEDP